MVSGRPEELKGQVFGDLAVVIVENKHYVNRYKTLKDSDFVRGKSPMTKEAVRNLSVAALEIQPDDVVYDIGAGTGSVTCAMAYRACESMVCAVEKEDYAVELVRETWLRRGRGTSFCAGLWRRRAGRFSACRQGLYRRQYRKPEGDHDGGP